MISKSPTFSLLKLYYYKFFAFLYGLVGRFSSLVLVNSSWTLGHINAIWNIPTRSHILFPPCDTSSLRVSTIQRSGKMKPAGKFGLFSQRHIFCAHVIFRQFSMVSAEYFKCAAQASANSINLAVKQLKCSSTRQSKPSQASAINSPTHRINKSTYQHLNTHQHNDCHVDGPGEGLHQN